MRIIFALNSRVTNACFLFLFLLGATSGSYAQSTFQMFYKGGNVMSGPTNAYVIYYGPWSEGAQTIINTWLSSLGGTGLYGINSAYYDSNGPQFTNEYVQNVLNYNPSTGSYLDIAESQGAVLHDPNVQAIVANAINNGLPTDSSGVYFVLLGTGVSDFWAGYQMCVDTLYGYHSHAGINDSSIKYAVVGKCTDRDYNILNGDSKTPNGHVAADEAINVMFHEVSESVTDPKYDTWGTGTSEDGDQCWGNFGTWNYLPVAANGAHFNVTIAGKNYLIQKLGQIDATGTLIAGYTYPGTCEFGNISLTSTQNPISVGQALTFTVTVAGRGTPPTTPTGIVSLYKDGTLLLGTAQLSNGQATFRISFGSSGEKLIQARYSGYFDGNNPNYDSYDAGNSAVLVETVN